MKLISMADYVWSQPQSTLLQEVVTLERIVAYANFLKTPLELGMFVPCDEDGNVLKEPKGFHDYMEGVRMGLSFKGSYNETKEQYQQAKERVIFEPIDWPKKNEYRLPFIIEFATQEGQTIEQLVRDYEKLTLTPAKAKELGL